MLDLSGKIDSLTYDILSGVADIATAEGLDFFVVGATARDLILYHGYGINPGSATMDVDIAVLLPDWPRFQRLVNALLTSGDFTRTAAIQRLLYRGQLPLDIVPFGGLAQEEKVRWPPDEAIILNVLGFAEAFASSIPVRLQQIPEVVVKFASPAGWALLKLISWDERGLESGKDAEDLHIIIRNYAEAGNLDRLYESERELLTVEDHDLILAGARLLGMDIARLCREPTREAIQLILDRETHDRGQNRLVTSMLRGGIEPESFFEETLNLLLKLKQGFENFLNCESG